MTVNVALPVAPASVVESVNRGLVEKLPGVMNKLLGRISEDQSLDASSMTVPFAIIVRTSGKLPV